MGNQRDEALLQQSFDGCLKLFEGLTGRRRGFQATLAVNEKNGRIASNIAIETGDVAIQGEQRIGYRNLFQEFELLRYVFVGNSENNEALLFFVLI